jgi:ElaB/YqjD/DUF883 family membrane-anchored ribosome-binding protein
MDNITHPNPLERAEKNADAGLSRVTTDMHGAIDTLSSAASQIVGNIGAKGEQISAASNQAMSCARNYVRQHPLAAIGAALAVGVVLSRVLRTR